MVVKSVLSDVNWSPSYSFSSFWCHWNKTSYDISRVRSFLPDVKKNHTIPCWYQSSQGFLLRRYRGGLARIARDFRLLSLPTSYPSIVPDVSPGRPFLTSARVDPSRRQLQLSLPDVSPIVPSWCQLGRQFLMSARVAPSWRQQHQHLPVSRPRPRPIGRPSCHSFLGFWQEKSGSWLAQSGPQASLSWPKPP